jgi:chromosome partitioning protein
MQTWAVIAEKGGAGKTTIATHVSIALTQMGKTVEVLDVDPQQTLAKWGIQRGTKRPRILPVLASQIFETLEQTSHRQIDIVVVDTCGRADRDSLIVAKAADLIIVPVRARPYDISSAASTIDVLRRAGYADKVVFVLNGIVPKVPEMKDAARYLKTLGPELCPHSLGERLDYWRPLLVGRGVTEAKKNSDAVREITALTKWLIYKANALTKEVKDGKGKRV